MKFLCVTNWLTVQVVGPIWLARCKGVAGLLAILGLFGVMMAGLAADALISGQGDEADDSQDVPPEGDGSISDGDLLDDLTGDPTIPTSDDIADPIDEDVTVVGTADADVLDGLGGNDEIEGGDGADLINGRGGDDSIDAGSGNDAVWAGAGDDSIRAADGNDSVYGDQGDDTMDGGVGQDSLAGCDGDDSLSGGAGNDTLLGGQGNDWLDGGEDDDWLSGGDGDDRLSGKAGTDELDGGGGDDTISGVEAEGGQESDFVNGGDGNDQLILGAGDHATGGLGNDDFVLQDWLNEASVIHIADYDPDADRLVIVYDQIVHPDPVLTVEPNEGGMGQSIFIDGAKVAVVNGAPVSVDDVRLVAA